MTVLSKTMIGNTTYPWVIYFHCYLYCVKKIKLKLQVPVSIRIGKNVCFSL